MRKKILIVDDEPNIVMSLEYAFKKKDFEVFIARDGTEALEIAEKETPDLILLDIMMPEMDGYETLKRVRGNKKLQHTKVVFLSAKSKEKDIEKGLKMGADSYMTKPFSIKKIISDIEGLIDKKIKRN
ncbi:response regulator transcription factor [Flagellimonas lutimaris]|uniref:response regulator transcription factor n=1 Tax=Flagellimonas lutimaris TaxID=475082 RepID=UPI003F5CC819